MNTVTKVMHYTIALTSFLFLSACSANRDKPVNPDPDPEPEDSLVFTTKFTTNNWVYTDDNWMLLFINADCNRKTGWEGYDFLVNSEVKSDETTTLKYWDGSAWVHLADIPYRVSGNEMELSIPLALLNLEPSDVTFDFKWADNIQKLDDINEFFINGDVAPERRFDYYYGNFKKI